MKISRIFLVFVTLVTVFISCQKEIDWGQGGGSSTGGRLVRIKSQTGTTDTTQIDYSYDASGRLTRELTKGIGGGMSLDNDLIINRNSAGIITSLVQKNPNFIILGIDSVITRVYYNTTSSRYTAAAFDLGIPGFTVTDSAVYNYDANNRIIDETHYMSTPGLPLPPFVGLKNIYVYNPAGNNRVSIAQEASTTPGGPLSPVSLQVFTYDTRTNPLITLNEAIVTARTGNYNANNVTKVVFTNSVDPSLDFTLDGTFVYNSNNKPDSASTTRSPGGEVTKTRYFYQ